MGYRMFLNLVDITCHIEGELHVAIQFSFA